jgi:hypothetical protein
MPTTQDPQEELRDYYLERYKRIKDERKTVLNTLIGLSGSCVVLSVTFFEKIAPHKRLIALVIVAWSLFGMAIFVSIYGLMKMIYQSQKYQRVLKRALDDDKESAELKRGRLRTPTNHGPTTIFQDPEYLAGISFGLECSPFAVFAIINLMG